VVHVLYSSKFDGAIETLRWLCLGMALRAITWPIGFIVAATGRQFLLFAIEFAWAFVNVVLTLFFVDRMGLVGAGVAFFFSYIFHAVVLYPLVGHLTGFRWTRENILVGLTYIAACSIVVTASYTLPTLAHVAVGTVVCAFLTLQSLLRIVALSSTGTVQRPVARLIGLGRSIRRRF
jgi:PST family polysaccharide transporter